MATVEDNLITEMIYYKVILWSLVALSLRRRDLFVYKLSLQILDGRQIKIKQFLYYLRVKFIYKINLKDDILLLDTNIITAL